jgi:hypothetical protein
MTQPGDLPPSEDAHRLQELLAEDELWEETREEDERLRQQGEDGAWYRTTSYEEAD